MKVLTEQAELAFGEAKEAKPCGSSKHSSDGLAVTYVAAPPKLPIVIWHSQNLTH